MGQPQKPIDLVVMYTDDFFQDDAEHLSKLGRVAKLLWNPRWLQVGADECHLSNWQFGEFPNRVSSDYGHLQYGKIIVIN
jgi:hypothetical protein